MRTITLKSIGLASPLSALAVWPMLVYYYLGGLRVLALVSYLIALIIFILQGQTRHPGKGALLGVWLVLLIDFIIGLFTFGDPLSHVLSFRLIYGFAIFLLGYVYIEKIDIEKIFVLLATWTVFEKIVLVLSPGLVNLLPNYDGGVTFTAANAASLIGGVHSFGGNRSVSGVILLAGFIYSIDKPISRAAKVVILFASLLCVSGTSLLMTAAYLIWLALARLRKSGGIGGKAIVLGGLGLFLTVLGPVFLATTYEDAVFDRFSLYYIDYLFGYKWAQIEDFMNSADTFGYIFGLGASAFSSGSEEVAGYGSRYGDFEFLDFFSRYGFLGTVVLFVLFRLAMRRSVALPVLVIVLGTMHYHVLFSGPGQVVAALFLAKGLQVKKLSRGGLSAEAQELQETGFIEDPLHVHRDV